MKWIFERCDGKVHAQDTPIGRVPDAEDMDTSGLKIPPTDLAKLLSVDRGDWLAELPKIREHFAKFGDRLPEELNQEVRTLEERLQAAKE